MSEFRIERLRKQPRKDFDCGVEALNGYLVAQANQEMRRCYSTCFVLVEVATGKVAGYYTLSASSIPLTGLSQELVKRLPRYPAVPVARVGRLAIDRAFHGRGLGSALIHDALLRASFSEVAAYAMVVDAKDEAAARFYERLGFIRLVSQPLHLFLPIERNSRRDAD